MTTNWMRRIYLRDVWETEEPNGIATAIAKRLRRLQSFGEPNDALDRERNAIADEFEVLGRDPETTAEDFDKVMMRLYDWGDTELPGHLPHRACACWISTII